MEVTLNITHETFKNDKGVDTPYVKFWFELAGEKFNVKIDEKDKRLLNHCLKANGFYDEKKGA